MSIHNKKNKQSFTERLLLPSPLDDKFQMIFKKRGFWGIASLLVRGEGETWEIFFLKKKKP